MGCQQAQGYHLSRPVGAGALEESANRLRRGEIDLGRHAGAEPGDVDRGQFSPSGSHVPTRS